jgi:hypothetical protein
VFSPANPPNDFQYIESDVPPGVGLREWRRAQEPKRRRGFPARLLAAVHVGAHESRGSHLRLA